MHPLARAARVLGDRLVELEKRLSGHPNDPTWAEYVETARVLAQVVEAQKVVLTVVRDRQSSGSPAMRAR